MGIIGVQVVWKGGAESTCFEGTTVDVEKCSVGRWISPTTPFGQITRKVCRTTNSYAIFGLQGHVSEFQRRLQPGYPKPVRGFVKASRPKVATSTLRQLGESSWPLSISALISLPTEGRRAVGGKRRLANPRIRIDRTGTTGAC